MKQSIIIIGAGSAGLIAANELAADFDITILEANVRSGGRIHSIQQGDHIIEAGAEFIHGKLPLTLRLLKEAGIAYLPVEGNMYRKKNGQFVEQDDIIPGWDELLEQMKILEDDMPLQEFLETYFTGNDPLQKYALAYAEGFDLVDGRNASVQSLYKEWHAETEDNYRIPAGYTALIKHLGQEAIAKGCRILFNKKVTTVHWEQNDVTVYAGEQERFYGNKLLVTAPLSSLQQTAASIQFHPSIPIRTEAVNNIGYGSVIKIILEFKQPFWQDDMGFIFSDEKYFPTWWTQLPSKHHSLTGWMGGSTADEISAEGDDDILQKALESLSNIFAIATAQLKELIVHSSLFNWKKIENAWGGYSYDTVDSPVAKKILNNPMANTIFFAGEALYSGEHPGTVEAALVSGIQTAQKIMDTR